MWARLPDDHHAHRPIAEAPAGNTYPNVFDSQPPFHIDSDSGRTAGIAEVLLQSHGGESVLLPPLPSAWLNGSVSGFRV